MPRLLSPPPPLGSLIHITISHNLHQQFQHNHQLTSSIIMITTVLSTAIILTVSLYYLIRLISRLCHHSPSIAADDVISDTSDSSLRQPGTPDELVSSLPLIIFGSVAGKIAASDYSVCLSRFKPQDQLRLLPLCCHAFHSRCVDTWLASNLTCPICRSTIDPAVLESIHSASAGDEIGSGSPRQEATDSGEGRRLSFGYTPVTPSAPYLEESPIAEYLPEPPRHNSAADCSLPSPTHSHQSEGIVPAADDAENEKEKEKENEEENRIWESVSEWCNWLSL